MNSSSTNNNNNSSLGIASFAVDKPGKQKFAPKIGRSAQPAPAVKVLQEEPQVPDVLEEATTVEAPTPKAKPVSSAPTRSRPTTAPQNPKTETSESVLEEQPEKVTMAYYLKDRKVGVPMVNSPVPQKQQKGSQEAAPQPPPPKKVTEQPTRVSRIGAPQVKVVDGKVVLDEDSMHATISPQEYLTDMTVVNESHRRLTSATFAKRRVVSNRWSKGETDLFYEALGMCGTDFSMIETLLSHRSRAQIKGKYKIEERSDALRLAHTLATPKPYDSTFPERVRAFLEESNK